MIEKLLLDEHGNIPVDYKFFSFRGRTKVIQIDIDRFSNHERLLLDMDWQKIPVQYNYPTYEGHIKKPSNLKEMIIISNKLTEEFDFARIDLYSCFNKIYFGEITFTPDGGLGKFNPEKYDRIFGDYYKKT